TPSRETRSRSTQAGCARRMREPASAEPPADTADSQGQKPRPTCPCHVVWLGVCELVGIPARGVVIGGGAGKLVLCVAVGSAFGSRLAQPVLLITGIGAVLMVGGLIGFTVRWHVDGLGF